MLSEQDNQLLTRVGPGTGCGQLMRRYWQPAALAEELPPGGAPLPIRLLGEDLVLFRGEAGRPGLLALHCSHRGADLSYGRLEDGGLRCIYHGWLYDVNGRCLEQPGEPQGSTFHERIRQTAYPCIEAGEIIFAYLGPGDPPLLPAYEILTVPSDHRYVSKTFQNCNYQQGNEGNLDSQHHSFLHRIATDDDDEATRLMTYNDGSPLIEPEETDFGVRVYSIRQAPPDRMFVKATNFIFPNLSAVTGYRDGYSINWHVPIDDTHHWKYFIRFNRRLPLDRHQIQIGRGETTPEYKLIRSASNRYLQDREEMQASTYAGLGDDFIVHDTWATETQGEIQDRTREHLGYNERGIIAMRKVMLEAIRDVEAGHEPPHVVRDPLRNQFSHMAAMKEVVSSGIDWRRYMEERGCLTRV